MAVRSAKDEVFDQRLLDTRAPSLARLFRDRVAASGPRQAFQFFRGDALEHLTWDETRARVDALAAGL
ncbi:MAG: long-chain fatty acid--CoA ligase, partial [Lapillicoccus sp.]